jgi:hypothetical protein
MNRYQAVAMVDVLATLDIQTMMANAMPEVKGGEVEYMLVVAPVQPRPLDVVKLAMACHFRGYSLLWTKEQGFIIDPPQNALEASAEDCPPGHFAECRPQDGIGTRGCPVCEAMQLEAENVGMRGARQTCLTLHGRFCAELPCMACGNPGLTQNASVYTHWTASV